MLRNWIAKCLILLGLLSSTHSECPNACNGKGVCGAHDVCTCYRGWRGNDCSQRICSFGRAHVDVPKGDLDGTGTITGAAQVIIKNSQTFKYGTTERYPSMIDSDQQILHNSAHEYTECSSKGLCVKSTGLCECAPGYEGNACQYASCPNKCSGHGVCVSASEWAKRDSDNNYNLWDADITLACVCDPGFAGADCSLKKCKVGYDPLYNDPGSSHRFSNWSYVVYHRGGVNMPIKGNYSIIFHDQNDEDWQTEPISYGASCSRVVRALEMLPNNVIPSGTVRCTQWTNINQITNADEPMLGGICTQFLGCQGNLRFKGGVGSFWNGIKYTLAFPGNPGVLKPLSFNWHLDGNRPTMYTTELESTLDVLVYANGFTGEYFEYFTQKCVGVDVNLVTLGESPSQPTSTILGGLTPLEFRYLAACLGTADNLPDSSATVVVGGKTYTWDYGTTEWPHLVRLVDQTHSPTTDLCDERSVVENEFASSSDTNRFGGRSGTVNGRSCSLPSGESPPGFIAVMYYDPAAQVFKLLNRPGEDFSSTTQFAVFTTTGFAHMVSNSAKVYTNNLLPYSTTVYTVNTTNSFPSYRGNLDCLANRPRQNGAFECIEKGDKIFFLDPALTANNPKYINIHSVKRVYTANSNIVDRGSSPGYVRIVVDSAMTSFWPKNDLTVNGRVYKFFPPGPRDPPQSSYQYVAECSNRGICQQDTGLCECFKSFTGDDCSVENNFADVRQKSL